MEMVWELLGKSQNSSPTNVTRTIPFAAEADSRILSTVMDQEWFAGVMTVCGD